MPVIRRTRRLAMTVAPAPNIALGQQVFHPIHGRGQLDCIINTRQGHPDAAHWRVGVMKIATDAGFREFRRAYLREFKIVTPDIKTYLKRTRAPAK